MSAKQSDRMVDYLLIGGGLAAATAAEQIRKQDSTGSIVLVTNDERLPYHRPPLSKEYLRGEIGADGVYGKGGVYVQLPDWYQEQNIEVLRNVEARKLDTQARTVMLQDGRTLAFKSLLLATGGRPRVLDIPGVRLPGVYMLRTLADADTLRAKIQKGQRIVIIGSGFIGLEGAASALSNEARVSIIEPQERIWPKMVAPEISAYFQSYFERHGAMFYYQHSVEAIANSKDGKLVVKIAPKGKESQMQEIPCDFVIIGIGIQLNTELAESGGLEIDPKHGIIVDEHLETRVADIFAAGDIAAYPDPLAQRMHFEHWDNAIASGEIAGTNMVGADEPYRHVPYFFSDQFDLSINMLGYPTSEARTIIRGQMNENKFTAVYLQQGIIRAALMVNDDGQMDTWRELIAASIPAPHEVNQLADPNFNLSSLLPSQ
ncbi:NAD(P)/FAD-dependent oxidoreductase [Tengunoibacter tsumagoiensis]|uniref:Pyridine nucleotide-disulfide oxidoreductase n=1 Tax=Tengunoibacter tsumagoiensis TaxID=2014871 RepID=A0A401ZTS3_9CHLR|nr:FAD-dependent oxidoreductase [Tengunoibacter tsumagoiensis]GCE10318.1 pyridine nucleotide-disulfide oxidoreductase [Tengunoibacter tsumagoiensis]